MTRKEELIDTLARTFNGDAWHGPALQDVLADVTAEEAYWKPAAHVHSIWEIALHLAAWYPECARRLDGETPQVPAAGDWPEIGAQLDNDGWEDAVQQIFNGRDQLLAAIRKMDEAALDSTENTSLQASVSITRAGLIEGIAQHNTYHTGQMALLKKLARAVV